MSELGEASMTESIKSPQELQAQLRRRGLRLTAQREVVFAAVNELRHATPEQILNAVAEEMPGITLSTVYRVLDVLEQLGLVTHAHMGHAPMTYHAVDEHRHMHVVCEGCGAIESVDAATAEEFARTLSDVTGYDVDVTHMAIAGCCRSCASRSKA
jgi:Fur family ferric uptake transcriptional regulator